MKDINIRDGHWLDPLGCCRVCDGEIPYGHTDNCDIYAMERKIKAATNLVEKMEWVYNRPEYKAVWFNYANHGGDYTNGPKWVDEFEKLKKELHL